MKKLLLASIVAVAFCGTSAVAADLPMKARPAPVEAPAYDPWTGFYVGGNVGYGWSNSVDTELFADSTTPTNIGDSTTTSRGTIGTLFGEGWFGGGQIGYNARLAPNWMAGIETDLQGSNIHDSIGANFTNPNGTFNPIVGNANYNVDWFGTVRGRVGFTNGPSLIYLTGGLAYGNVHYRLSGVETGGGALYQTFLNTESTRVGWVLGGGFEWAFAPNWSAKFEYQYIDLGSVSASAPVTLLVGGAQTDTAHTASVAAKFQTVRLGLNYKFDWGKAPVVSAKY